MIIFYTEQQQADRMFVCKRPPVSILLKGEIVATDFYLHSSKIFILSLAVRSRRCCRLLFALHHDCHFFNLSSTPLNFISSNKYDVGNSILSVAEAQSIRLHKFSVPLVYSRSPIIHIPNPLSPVLPLLLSYLAE